VQTKLFYPPSDRFMNAWTYTFTTLYLLMAFCLIKHDGDSTPFLKICLWTFHTKCTWVLRLLKANDRPIPVAEPSKAWVCTVRLLGLRVRIPPTAWMSVSCECCVLSGRGLCDGLVTRPEESYRMRCVCDREALIMRRPWPTRGCCAMGREEDKLWD
jgi:hypothetical protein